MSLRGIVPSFCNYEAYFFLLVIASADFVSRSNLPYNTIMYRQYYVYIMTNSLNTVLYVGVTNDLVKRVYAHKEKLVEGFTKKYNITKLVYYEIFEDIENAILREKQIKAGSRQKKIDLIDQKNRHWRDLYSEL